MRRVRTNVLLLMPLYLLAFAAGGCSYIRGPEVPVVDSVVFISPRELPTDCPGELDDHFDPAAELARLETLECRLGSNELRRLLQGARIVFDHGMSGLEPWTYAALKMLRENAYLMKRLTPRDRALLYLIGGRFSVVGNSMPPEVKGRIDALRCRMPAELDALSRLEVLRFHLSRLCSERVAGNDPREAVDAARRAFLQLLSDHEEASGYGSCSREEWCALFAATLDQYGPAQAGSRVAARYMELLLMAGEGQ